MTQNHADEVEDSWYSFKSFECFKCLLFLVYTLKENISISFQNITRIPKISSCPTSAFVIVSTPPRIANHIVAVVYAFEPFFPFIKQIAGITKPQGTPVRLIASAVWKIRNNVPVPEYRGATNNHKTFSEGRRKQQICVSRGRCETPYMYLTLIDWLI